jgi:hypothetical protein
VGSGLGQSEDIVSDSDDVSVSKVWRSPWTFAGADVCQALYAADILYILSIGSSKGATVFLTYRLTKTKEHILASYALAVFVTLWTVASVFVVAIRDNHSQPWLNRNDETQGDLVCALQRYPAEY